MTSYRTPDERAAMVLADNIARGVANPGRITEGLGAVCRVQAEEFLIGVTMNRGLNDRVRRLLPSGEMFAAGFNGATWDAILATHDGTGKADRLLVVEALNERAGKAAGDELMAQMRGHLRDLMDSVAVPTEKHLVAQAQLVRDAWIKRRAAKVALVTEALSYDPNIKPADVLERLAVELAALQRDTDLDLSIEDERKASMYALHAELKAKPTDVLTGFPTLDDWTMGLHAEQITLLGGGTSAGKSALALQIALNVARRGRAVLYVSLEMTPSQVIQRAAAHIGQVNTRWVKLAQRRMLTPQEFALAQDGAVKFMALPWHTRNKRSTAEDIVAEARRCKEHYAGLGSALSLVVVDHVGLVEGSRHMKAPTPKDTTTHAVRTLRRMAQEVGVHVLVLSQLRRECMGREPTLSDFANSSDLERDTDNALLLHRPDREGPATLHLAKNRNDGQCGRITLDPDMKHATFREVTS